MQVLVFHGLQRGEIEIMPTLGRVKSGGAVFLIFVLAIHGATSIELFVKNIFKILFMKSNV